ncbi:hypothetical protein GCM10025868_04420 [Angustibacter aerolatus]|uniref:Uncharacterized protein n=1 Tax=Angustibacter aerolatus TaxID=1162965 RepID=A0ABQ6JBL5_9ACTN|nr:hypothetical protein GCM10025868_04420 [Angustibacter aerolatus]
MRCTSLLGAGAVLRRGEELHDLRVAADRGHRVDVVVTPLTQQQVLGADLEGHHEGTLATP